MSANSKIEWTQATWNPVTGCTKVSPGCAHCYAERMAKRLKAMGSPKYVNGFEVTLHPGVLDEPLRWRKPRMVFVCSMSDLFHEKVPDGFIRRVFEVMEKASQHTFQVLTKRAKRMADLLTQPDWPLPHNVWVGVTTENEKYFDQRVPHLMRITRASVRFISAEPLLGEIWLPPWVRPGTPTCACRASLYHGWPSMDPDAVFAESRCPECGRPYTRTSGIERLAASWTVAFMTRCQRQRRIGSSRVNIWLSNPCAHVMIVTTNQPIHPTKQEVRNGRTSQAPC